MTQDKTMFKQVPGTSRLTCPRCEKYDPKVNEAKTKVFCRSCGKTLAVVVG